LAIPYMRNRQKSDTIGVCNMKQINEEARLTPAKNTDNFSHFILHKYSRHETLRQSMISFSAQK